MAIKTDLDRGSKADHLPGVRGVRARRSEAPGAPSSRSLLPADSPGIRTSHPVEPHERVHVGVQGTRSDTSVQSYRQALRLPARRADMNRPASVNNPGTRPRAT